MKKEKILEELEDAGFEISEEVRKSIPEKEFDVKIFSMTPPIRY